MAAKIGAIVLTLVTLLSCLGVGRWLLRRLLPDDASLPRNVYGAALGLALLSLIATFSLALGLPLVASTAIYGAAGLALGMRELRQASRELPFGDRWLTAVVVAYVLASLVGALAPETGWDAGVYHFAIAKQSAESNTLVARLDVPQSFFPMGWETLYAIGFALFGEPQASLVNVAVFLITLGAVRALAGEYAQLAMLLFLGNFTVAAGSSGGNVELAQALYVLIGFDAIRRAATWQGSLVGGVFWGEALCIKASSLIPMVVCLVWIAAERHLWRQAAISLAVAAAMSAFWPIRNWVLTGNPAYPFMTGMFGSAPSGLEPFLTPPQLPGDFLQFIRFAAIDPALLLFPLGFFVPRLRKQSAALVAIVALLFATNPMGPENAARYCACVIPLAAITTAEAFAGITRRQAALRLGAVGIAALLAVGVLGMHAYRNGRKAPAAIGLVTRDAYLSSSINTYWAIRRAESESRGALLLIDQRGYYCAGPYVSAHDQQHVFDFEAFSDSASLRAWMHAKGIERIVANEGGLGHVRRFEAWLAAKPEVWKGAVEELARSGPIALYKPR